MKKHKSCGIIFIFSYSKINIESNANSFYSILFHFIVIFCARVLEHFNIFSSSKFQLIWAAHDKASRISNPKLRFSQLLANKSWNLSFVLEIRETMWWTAHFSWYKACALQCFKGKISKVLWILDLNKCPTTKYCYIRMKILESLQKEWRTLRSVRKSALHKSPCGC